MFINSESVNIWDLAIYNGSLDAPRGTVKLLGHVRDRCTFHDGQTVSITDYRWGGGLEKELTTTGTGVVHVGAHFSTPYGMSGWYLIVTLDWDLLPKEKQDGLRMSDHFSERKIKEYFGTTRLRDEPFADLKLEAK